MNDGLLLQQKLYAMNNAAEIAKIINGESLRIALEKPPFWEYLLFANVFQFEIMKHREAKTDYSHGIVLGLGEYIDILQLGSCLHLRLAELKRMSDAANVLLNTVAVKAFGPPSVPGDVDLIVYLGKKLGDLYRSALDWAHKIRSTHSHEAADEILAEFSTFSSMLVSQLEDFGSVLVQKIRDAELRMAHDKEPFTISHILKLDFPTQDKFNAAMERLQGQIERGELSN